MIFDTHVHCEYSCDSEMKLPEALAAAAGKGMGIVVTEHWDYDYPTNPTAFTFDLDEYFRKYASLCGENLMLGIEIGMQKHIAADDDRVAAGRPFDFVLGSIHCVNGRDLYEQSCYRGQERKDAVREFLEEAIACAGNHDGFDSFAHIDYMCRYWPFDEPELSDAPELFDDFFRLLIKKEKPMEINTRRLEDAAAVRSLLKIYKRYRELGGRFCTIGSDAHLTDHIGRGFKTALAMAEEAGLKPVYFKARKMLPLDFGAWHIL